MASQFTPAQLSNIFHNMNGNTIDAFDNDFFAHHGYITVTTDSVSRFKAGGLVNGMVDGGTIFISNYAIDVLSNAAGISPLMAAQAILAHEAGHAYYKQTDYQTQPPDSADIGAKADWCLDREGRAAFFAFEYAEESGSHFVAGTSIAPNAYDTIKAAVAGLTPGTAAYEAAGIKIATNLYKADVSYIAYCYNPTHWNPGAYIPPENLPSGGTSGGGAVWSSGYVPEPGGYWRPVQNSSDMVIPEPNSPTVASTSSTEPALQDGAISIFVSLVGSPLLSYGFV